MDENYEKYREILISPVRQCASYNPKFGHRQDGGLTFLDFQSLYGQDAFYNWLGLNDKLVYSAHKAAGGITSIYRQIGIGCERMVREIFKDSTGLTSDEVTWSYSVSAPNGIRTLSLDGRIVVDKIKDPARKRTISGWVKDLTGQLQLDASVANAMQGVVFEVRQGYKSRDSKRQNADISNASNAYANGYIPCLMIMSSQIDEEIITRYGLAKWCILLGYAAGNSMNSTYSFFKEVIGFDMADFMNKNQSFFRNEMQTVFEQLLRTG